MEKKELAELLKKSRSAIEIFYKKDAIIEAISDPELKARVQGISSFVDFFAYKEYILKDLEGQTETKKKKRGDE